MKTFFLGVHHPADAAKVKHAFISVHALSRRKSMFPVNEWIMDSGAFSTIAKHGGYPEPVEDYASHIRRFAGCGRLLAAVSQDYMCEELMLLKTGLTVQEHQRLTIERYDELVSMDVGGTYIMPVLQGYHPKHYADHIRLYGDRLPSYAWVGVGSVCKRNGNPAAIEDVLLAIHAERPDLLLHGFGVKKTALESELVRDHLHTADSMAWSFAARYEGRDSNDINEAIRYGRRIERMPVQGVIRW